MLNRTMIFSLSANKKLAEDIANELDMKVSEAHVTHFADGEILCEPVESVREKDVYIVQSTYTPVTENLFEILVFVDACKRASSRKINVIIPYFGYARQDRKSKPRQPITSRLVADLLKTAGVDRVISVDLHAPQIQGFFSCLIDELTAIPLLATHYEKDNNSNLVVVSPDHGGVNRARRVAERINAPLAIIDKRRTGPNVAEVMNIVGDVQGKDCLMVDDMIDTAGSARAGALALKANGAKSVKICCSHGLFSGPAAERLLDGVFDEIVCTDSIPLPERMKSDKVKVVSLAPMISKVIENIENGVPVSKVYNIYNHE
ncbi:MAG: ribose-phosphate pyrophosphokinase [Bacilli bacterium]|nr:ribose-phosphate pyrophosphokinase [Erysipelotrichaceae bacterium]MDD6250190.1 ribose-phosphate pyrophosphokinase [Bacillales bacterium]MDY2745808.1 ribose-phosphate pyrophosphokinase [Bacilli bacterium]